MTKAVQAVLDPYYHHYYYYYFLLLLNNNNNNNNILLIIINSYKHIWSVCSNMLLSFCRKWASSSGFSWELQCSEAALGVCCSHAHRPLLFCPPTNFQYASCHWRGCSGTQQCCGSLVSVRHCVIYTQKNQVKSSTSVWNKHANLRDV